jgi:hypothetical protein
MYPGAPVPGQVTITWNGRPAWAGATKPFSPRQMIEVAGARWDGEEGGGPTDRAAGAGRERRVGGGWE